MKQKYMITKEENTIVIKEYAELDKELLALVCLQKYDLEMLKQALEQSEARLLSVLRTENMYPPIIYLKDICNSVQELLKNDEKQSIDLFFDDLKLLKSEREREEAIEGEEEEEQEKIDDLIEEELEDDFEDEEPISTIKSSLKIADDDAIEIDDDI